MNLQRIQHTLEGINQFGYLDKGITRLAYTKEEYQAKEYLMNLCKKEGLHVKIDECGNVIARREGRNPNLPAVAVGSHIDSVIEGGKFDGTIGVVGALEVIRYLNEKGVETEHPVELISFACEESSRFGVSTIGSKAMSGELNKESVSNLKDKDDVSISEAFAKCGLDFSIVEQAARKKDQLKAFFEMHIEQGSRLEGEKKQIGIVTGIASPTRLEVKVTGKASHSGTTLMDHRRDALLGASEIDLALEQAAKKEASKGTVATVGVFEVKPGAMNVIPDQVEMKIDIRSTSIQSKQTVFNELLDRFDSVSKTRGLSIDWNLLSDEKPVLLNQEIIDGLSNDCDKLGISYVHMASGAGHDAMNMASVCPTGLIFVPSVDGLSHHPDEYTSIEDIGLGVALLEEAVLKWSGAHTSTIS